MPFPRTQPPANLPGVLPQFAIAHVAGSLDDGSESPTFICHFADPVIIARVEPTASVDGFRLFAWTPGPHDGVPHALMVRLAGIYREHVEFQAGLPAQWDYQFGDFARLAAQWLVADGLPGSGWAGLVHGGAWPAALTLASGERRDAPARFTRWLGGEPAAHPADRAEIIATLEADGAAAWHLDWDANC